jgi:hypothetical protein
MSENILASIGSRRAPIIVQLSEYEGRRTLDVRRHFFNANGDLTATRKGIGLNKEAVAILKNTMQAESARIDEWLDALSPSASSQERDARRREEALDALKFGPRPFAPVEGEWRSPKFFDVEYGGHADSVRVNRLHGIWDRLKSRFGDDESSDSEQLLWMLLVAYARSRALFEGVGTMDSGALLDDLEFNWGVILERYLERQDR